MELKQNLTALALSVCAESALALAFTACSSVATAQSTPPDWKLYSITTRKPQAALFYLESELVRTPPGHVRDSMLTSSIMLTIS
jgi:hypothetical protein